MKENIEYQNCWETALQNISFVNRFKALSERYNERDYDKLESKTNKQRILGILKALGYNPKYHAGGDFNIRESDNLFSFQLLFIVKHGIITIYLNVYYGENRINTDFHFAFIYRRQVGNMNAEITLPKFSNYEEFEEIAKEITSIYEDFKAEFLKQVAEQEKQV